MVCIFIYVVVPITVSLSTRTMSTRRIIIIIPSGQTTGHHISVSNGISRGNCISYGGDACCSSRAKWSIIMTRDVVSYGLLTYVRTRGGSTSSLKIKSRQNNEIKSR